MLNELKYILASLDHFMDYWLSLSICFEFRWVDFINWTNSLTLCKFIIFFLHQNSLRYFESDSRCFLLVLPCLLPQQYMCNSVVVIYVIPSLFSFKDTEYDVVYLEENSTITHLWSKINHFVPFTWNYIELLQRCCVVCVCDTLFLNVFTQIPPADTRHLQSQMA